MDTHGFGPSDSLRASEILSNRSTADGKKSITVCKSPSSVMKMKDLSSNLLGQDCPFEKYSTVRDPAKAHSQVYDLVISGLPQTTQADDIKKITGAKHLVEVIVDHDAINNACTGTGKVRVRLGEDESLDLVKLDFAKAGYDVRESSTSQGLKPAFTLSHSLLDKTPPATAIDTKVSRMQNLQSTSPATFGNTGAFQS